MVGSISIGGVVPPGCLQNWKKSDKRDDHLTRPGPSLVERFWEIYGRPLNIKPVLLCDTDLYKM